MMKFLNGMFGMKWRGAGQTYRLKGICQAALVLVLASLEGGPHLFAQEAIA